MSKAKQKKNEEQLIYCGPSLPNNILVRFSIFVGGYPPHIESHLEKCPALRSMFVAVSEMNQAVMNIQKEATVENILYNEVLDYVRGGMSL